MLNKNYVLQAWQLILFAVFGAAGVMYDGPLFGEESSVDFLSVYTHFYTLRSLYSFS